MDKHKCSGNRKGGPEYTYGTCMSPGTILRDGKWYCWRHAPPDTSIRQAVRQVGDRLSK